MGFTSDLVLCMFIPLFALYAQHQLFERNDTLPPFLQPPNGPLLLHTHSVHSTVNFRYATNFLLQPPVATVTAGKFFQSFLTVTGWK